MKALVMTILLWIGTGIGTGIFTSNKLNHVMVKDDYIISATLGFMLTGIVIFKYDEIFNHRN